MDIVRSAFAAPWVQSLALLLLCGAYLQGAFDKARDFPAAVAEMRQFGLAPAAPLAAATIALEAIASAMVVSGWGRWLGALALAGFTLLANLLAARFWTLPAAERRPVANTFFEHLGLAGAFLLVAWHDLGTAP
ncbi:DoxX family protein [Pseudorhodoferax soli]|uniref:Putative membrane protein YphA (DoxX/SURF4 family) n=1 Tax=Pseudorhodoferax soli TaxID=545864 RepID=A0A368Y2I2_9BURK|nr:DoxX family protein [Pseudorhodoferax soli]RCW74510.1 putative membrane protein YphA (DoxX/SURF4 family) [Pseudorhodoferax soli]